VKYRMPRTRNRVEWHSRARRAPSSADAVRQFPNERPVQGDQDSAEDEPDYDPSPCIGLLGLSVRPVHGTASIRCVGSSRLSGAFL
jgi:hypothetical protein